MKTGSINVKSQAGLEYLIVIGIALALLTGFLIYSFYYTTAYNSSKNGQGLALVVNSVSGTVNYLSAQQYGSTFNFGFNSPGLSMLNSYLCANYIALASGGQQAAQTLSLPVAGEIPLGTGQFEGEGILSTLDGNPVVELNFNLPIAFINTCYLLSPRYVKYNICFQSGGGALVPVVNFTLFVYTSNNVLIASQNLSAPGGNYSGEIDITQAEPNLKIIVSVPSFGVSSASCLVPAATLPVTVVNTQFSATPSPFQQMVSVNSSEYSTYESAGLNNVQFSYTNGTIIPSWLESGNIATFNGINSFITTPQTYTFPFNSLTVAGWVNIGGFTSSNGVQDWWTGIYSPPAIGLQSYPNTFPNPTSSGFTFFLHNNTGSGPGCGFGPINLNTWYFVAEVVSGETATLYVNGAPACSFTFVENTAGRTHMPMIGAYNFSYSGR